MESTPTSFLNGDAVRGGVMGGLLALLAATVIETLVEKTLDLSAQAIGFWPVAGIVLIAVAGVVAGGYLGAKSGEKHREMAEGKQSHIMQSMSPELSQSVEYAMENQKDWGTKMLEKKLSPATQEQRI